MDETRKNFLSEVTDPQRQTWYVLTHKWILDINQRITSLHFITSEKLGNKDNPKRDIHEFPWEEEIDKIS